MEDRIRQAQAIVHRLANDLSGVKGLVELYTSGIRDTLDVHRVATGLEQMEQTLMDLKECLSPYKP